MANQTQNVNETDSHRLDILNSLLQTPHRELDKVYPVHKAIVDRDPLFYVKLGAWYNDHGDIRDNKEMFIINLVTHPDNEFREVGLAMLRELPPFEVVRVIDFVHKNQKRNIPRSVVTEIKRYLKEREEDRNFFDSAVLTARKHLKRLYALLHIQPNDYAQAVLFDNKPPEGSKLAELKKLSQLKEPAEQAKFIIENKIPYRVASTVVSNMTPSVLLALIEVMSPQELVNNLGALRKRGVFDNAELKNVVETKLKQVEKSKKVAGLKALEAVKAAGLSEDLNQALENVADQQMKAKGRIKRPTALLIDKSQSMNVALEVGKQIGSLVSSAMGDGVPFYCYAFDNITYPIEPKGKTLTDWNNAMKFIRASGRTCVGAGMVQLKNKKQVVEQIILVTDEGENMPPAFLKAYEDYCETLKVKPSVHIIRTPDPYGRFDTQISDKLERAGVELSTMEIKSATDYYSLPQVITYLSRPSRMELLMEIMNFELPKRKKAS